ncbi:MAG: aldehyde dehydrogenase family protein [Thermaerobacter sp.]|nr:aldehyde dehydrogenase family protein [Thermaerobacter sp.]
MAVQCQQFIGGQWLSATGKRVSDRDPSYVNQEIAYFYEATPDDVRHAIQVAYDAYLDWREVPAPQRGRVLLKAHQILSERREELALIMMREQGKTLAEARGEIQKGLNLLEFFAGEGFRLSGETTPSEIPHNFTYTVRQPLGVVAAITPWNFPFAIPVWKLAPALVAGNAVVFKPASWTPLMSTAIVKGFVDAGLPAGVLNMVLGSGPVVGQAIALDPLTKAVSFTGSNAVGASLQQQLAGRPIKLTMEMGGKNAVVVMPDADLAVAAEGVVGGAFGCAGQRCTATSRVLVHRAIRQQFEAACLARIEQIEVGPPDAANVTMGPVIDEHQLTQGLAMVEQAVAEGAVVLAGGHRLRDGARADGVFMAPTVLSEVRPEMAVARDEIFGPVLAMMSFDTLDAAIAIVNGVEYGLTASIYTQDIKTAQRFIERVEVGMVHVNNPTIGGEAQLPFGGIKSSGLGPREMAHEGTLFFTETKTVFLDYSGTRRTGNLY